MDSWSLLWDGILTTLTPVNIGLLAMGVLIGMVVGAVPGIGPSAGIAILLPITMGLDPVGGIIMLAAVYYGAMYGGTITSVLVNVPGDAGSVVATFDGHPLAKQGRAGPALVMAALGSFVAGTVGTILIVVCAPPLADLASRLGPAEMFLIIIAGLLTIVVVLGRNKLLGVISVLAGFAIGTVGVDLGGEHRYTFGSPDLVGGIDFVVVVIGVFGVGEMLHSLFQGEHARPVERIAFRIRSRAFWPSRTDVRESRGPIARGSVLGFVMGITPGAGAVLASFMSYGVEKSISKEPEKFGKGAMPGLVGQTANNAASSGAMVPLLTMGIPGSGSTAVLLTGFLMWGLQPGPLLMEQNPEFAWGLIASMYVGNVMLLLINIFCIPLFANVARIPLTVMAPTVILLCVFGTYAVHGSTFEVALMLGFGLLGLAMRVYGFSPGAMVIALILGGLAEQSFRQTMIISDGDLGVFLDRTPSMVILLIVAGLVASLLVSTLRGRRRADQPTPVDASALND